MTVDIAQLAAQTAAFLAPYLPYLIKGGKDAAQKAFEKTGGKLVDGAWTQAENYGTNSSPKWKPKPPRSKPFNILDLEGYDL